MQLFTVRICAPLTTSARATKLSTMCDLKVFNIYANTVSGFVSIFGAYVLCQAQHLQKNVKKKNHTLDVKPLKTIMY